MGKKTKILIILLLILLLLVSVTIILIKSDIIAFPITKLINPNEKLVTKLQQTNDITVVPTMQDVITADSSWCGTFQLVWNDMKNEVVKNDIIFSPQEEMANNLNKEKFT